LLEVENPITQSCSLALYFSQDDLTMQLKLQSKI